MTHLHNTNKVLAQQSTWFPPPEYMLQPAETVNLETKNKMNMLSRNEECKFKRNHSAYLLIICSVLSNSCLHCPS